MIYDPLQVNKSEIDCVSDGAYVIVIIYEIPRY